MLVVLSILGCTTPLVCGEGTHEEDGICLPDPDLIPITVAECDDAAFYDVDIEPVATLVNAKEIDVALSGQDAVSITCTLDATSITGEYDYTELISSGQEWRYFDLGTATGYDWADPEYDDGAWAVGPAPLGYGESEIVTEVSNGDVSGAKSTTTFFRFDFAYDGADADIIKVSHWTDDGIVLYLNGEEIDRQNMPEGAVTIETYASDSIEWTVNSVLLDPSQLLIGQNTFAARVHQSPEGNLDLFFDLAVEVGITADLSDFVESHTMSSDEIAPFHTVKFNGLLADATYDCAISLTCEASQAKPLMVSFTTDPLPDHVPEVVATTLDSDRASGGYVVYNQKAWCGDGGQMYFYLVDPEGRVRWYYEPPGITESSSMDLEISYLGDDMFLWGGGDHAATPRLLNIDHTSEYISSYPGAAEEGYHHDVLMTTDGELSGLVRYDNTSGGLTFEGFGIVQHDMDTREVTWSWNSQSAVDDGTLHFSGTGVLAHANSFSDVSDAAGVGYYVGLFKTESIVRVDTLTDKILYTLGIGGDFDLVDTDNLPLGNDSWFMRTHSVEATDDRLLMIDNDGPASKTRVLEYQIDTVGQVATLVWEWDAEDWHDPTWGDADALPNGNVLVTIGNSGCGSHNHAVLEVERESGDIVWRLDTIDGALCSYRSAHIDGCAIFANTRFCTE